MFVTSKCEDTRQVSCLDVETLLVENYYGLLGLIQLRFSSYVGLPCPLHIQKIRILYKTIQT